MHIMYIKRSRNIMKFIFCSTFFDIFRPLTSLLPGMGLPSQPYGFNAPGLGVECPP